MSDLHYLSELVVYAQLILAYQPKRDEVLDETDAELVTVVEYHLETVNRAIDRLVGVPPKTQRTDSPHESIVRLHRASKGGVNDTKGLKVIFGITKGK